MKKGILFFTAMQNTSVNRSDAFHTFSTSPDKTITFIARTKVDEGIFETKSYTIQYKSSENLHQYGGEGPGIKVPGNIKLSMEHWK